MESKLYFFDSLPLDSKKSSILIADIFFKDQARYQDFFSTFGACYFIEAGEKAKDYKKLPIYYEKLIQLSDKISSPLEIYGMGGGSITDTVGFLAATFKRGVKLHFIPTTWLCALDSAHGGKNAFNIDSFKNQIGTIYFPKAIYLIKEILENQPLAFASDALSEALKILLLKEKEFWFKKHQGALNFLQTDLAKLIQYKYDVVNADPYDQLRLRFALNLGHTVGHVFELFMSESHGEAIKQGLFFALEWSAYKKYLDVKTLDLIYLKMEEFHFTRKKYPTISKDHFLNLLKKDKKVGDHESLYFVFLKDLGEAVVEKVSFSQVLEEAIRQGLVE